MRLILALLTATKRYAVDFQASLENGTLTKHLDPLQASLFELAHTWSRKLNKPIRIMHDAQNSLTDHVMKMVMTAANHKMPAGYNLPDRNFELVGIEHIDSRADPRIQLADIAAGFTRKVAESALTGTATPERLAQVLRLVHFNSIWGDSESWEQIRPRDSFEDAIQMVDRSSKNS